MQATTPRKPSLSTATLATALLLTGGCGHSPEQTVTLTITGSMDEAKRDEIKETLKAMTDGSGHSMSSRWSGQTMTVDLSPVSDVDAFAAKIDFGEVTAVNGRSIEVTLAGEGETAEPDDAGGPGEAQPATSQAQPAQPQDIVPDASPPVDSQPDGPAAGATANDAGNLRAPGRGAESKNTVSGTLFGKEFNPDRFEISQGSILEMRQGQDFFADAEVKVFLFLDKGESPAGKSWNVTSSTGFGAPHVHAGVKKEEGGIPDTEIFTDDYQMTLSLSEPQSGRLVGKIELTLPTEQESSISGTFHVEPPVDPNQPPGERQRPFIHGNIGFDPQSEDWLRAGYTGVTADGERQSNMAGTKVEPDSNGGWAESTTFKPRNTRIDTSLDGPPRYRHVRLSPGTYLAYVKWGETWLASRWVEVAADSEIELNFDLNPAESGSLEVQVPADSRQKHVRLLPLDERGELPQGIPEDEARRLTSSVLSAEVEEGTARFESLKAGRYRVFATRDHAEDVTIQAGQTAQLDTR